MKMNVFSPEQALCKFYSLVSKTIFEIGYGKKNQYPLLTEEISPDMGKKYDILLLEAGRKKIGSR